MPAYIPIHDRPPYHSSAPLSVHSDRPLSPRYASPDLDPSEVYPWTREGAAMAEYDQRQTSDDGYGERGLPEGGYQPDGNQDGAYGLPPAAGPSRKRPRMDGTEAVGAQQRQPSTRARNQAAQPIIPSLFGIAPRNDLTKKVGEFIMRHARGLDQVEIEIKLGTLMARTPPGEPPRRLRVGPMNEMAMPPDYPMGNFVSGMNLEQNKEINKLLNYATRDSLQTECPIKFFRAQQTDSFHTAPGQEGKVRVSRDRSGQIVEGGVIQKTRLGDLNISNDGETFDWRISVSVETPCELPTSPPNMERDKDRACYVHQLCRVDLTVVKAKLPNGKTSSNTYELELEILDVPALIAEGEKEERNEPNRFDEILQSCLDSVRMLIRNCR